jgi:hypothetical protein
MFRGRRVTPCTYVARIDVTGGDLVPGVLFIQACTVDATIYEVHNS